MSNFQCDCIELNLQTPTDYFGRFVFKPLDVGDGITIGNILRRVLLTNLSGMSIIGARIAGVTHEFSTIPGVREDVLEILLNLNGVILKGQKQKESFGRLKIQGPAIITAASLNLEADIEIVNPSHYIATIANDSTLEIELKLNWGRGYLLAENQSVEESIDFLRMDAIFMPIRRVVYNIEKIGLEEQLTLDVWTNGSITPPDAVSLASKKIQAWFKSVEKVDKKSPLKGSFLEQEDIKLFPVEELNLSTRAYNALKSAQIDSIGKLLSFSLQDLKKIKNFGQKSIQEVTDALENTYGVFLD